MSALPIPYVTNAGIFIILRSIQGIAVGAINTAARTVLIDLFDGEIFKKYINTYTIAWSLSPIIAPVIGTQLIHWFNWTACFYALCIYSIIAIILVHAFFIRSNTSVIPLDFNTFKKNATRIIKNRDYGASLILVTISYSSLTAFYVMGPFIIQNVLNKSPSFYGHCAGIIGCAWLTGNLAVKLFSLYNIQFRVLWAINLMISLCLLSFMLLNTLPLLYTYMGFLICYVIAAACIFPTMFAYCLNRSRDIAGTVSALTGAGFWFFGGLTSMAAGAVNEHHHINIFYTYSVLTLLLIFFLSILFTHDK